MKLEGVKVLDLSMFLPGPLMTQMMADHGAEVIRIEPSAGEPNREIGLKRDGVTVYFANTHRGKQSLTLNLKQPEAVEIVHRLAKDADVVVEGFRPGVAERLGVGPKKLREINPGLVYASLSAFGQDGPYRDRPAHDPSVQALVGTMWANEGLDGKPTLAGVQAADMLNCTMALSGVLMALLRRATTGEGDYLDIAMMDSVIACMPNNMGPMFAEDRAPVIKEERVGGGYAMMSVYETKDGKFVCMGGAEIKFAKNLMTHFGRPDLVDICALEPGKAQDPARDFLRATFLTKTRDEWDAELSGMDICFGPVMDLKEGLQDPQLLHREMVITDDKGWKHLGIPMKFQDEPGRIDFEAPSLGRDNESIAGSVGFSADEVAAMKEKGVF